MPHSICINPNYKFVSTMKDNITIFQVIFSFVMKTLPLKSEKSLISDCAHEKRSGFIFLI